MSAQHANYAQATSWQPHLPASTRTVQRVHAISVKLMQINVVSMQDAGNGKVTCHGPHTTHNKMRTP